MSTEGNDLTKAITASFDLSVFDLESIKRACYRVSSAASVEISTEAGTAICVLHMKKAVPQGVADEMLESLRLEVLDQDLRKSISEETATIRTAVLAFAFSRSGLQADE